MFSTMNKRINHLGSLFDVLMNPHCLGLSVIARNEAILTICIHAARDVHKHFVIFYSDPLPQTFSSTRSLDCFTKEVRNTLGARCDRI